MSDLVERMRGFEDDHTPDGWPAVRMRDISGLCDEIAALRAELDDAKKDAERLSWLEQQNADYADPNAWVVTRCDFPDEDDVGRYWVGSDLRSAIDTAIAGEKK